MDPTNANYGAVGETIPLDERHSSEKTDHAFNRRASEIKQLFAEKMKGLESTNTLLWGAGIGGFCVVVATFGAALYVRVTDPGTLEPNNLIAQCNSASLFTGLFIGMALGRKQILENVSIDWLSRAIDDLTEQKSY